MRETIAAIATAQGVAAVGVVRISGAGAFEAVRTLCSLPTPPRSHRALLRTLRHKGRTLDQALVLPFVGPASFTGEDVVELHCHGGRHTLQTVLDALGELGVRTAEPGEFSRRAMLNGKLDLVQVEAIADIIEARSSRAHQLAQEHLQGRLSTEIDRLKAELFELMTLVEAAIDFSLEEHVYSISIAEVESRIEPILVGFDELLATYDAGRLSKEGIRLAIVGLPNAGKSTLLNVLLREDRALVTSIAGTTRDYLEESVQVDGVLFRLVDTAGIRHTDDVVEAMGVERSRAMVERADALLAVVDVCEGVAEARALVESLPDKPTSILWNKLDQLAGDSKPPSWWNGLSAAVSLTDPERYRGELESVLIRLADATGMRLDEDSILITRARHRDALLEAREGLERALDASRSGLEHELVALDLRESLDALGRLTGAVTSDDVLGRIFSSFCVGK